MGVAVESFPAAPCAAHSRSSWKRYNPGSGRGPQHRRINACIEPAEAAVAGVALGLGDVVDEVDSRGTVDGGSRGQ